MFQRHAQSDKTIDGKRKDSSSTKVQGLADNRDGTIQRKGIMVGSDVPFLTDNRGTQGTHVFQLMDREEKKQAPAPPLASESDSESDSDSDVSDTEAHGGDTRQSRNRHIAGRRRDRAMAAFLGDADDTHAMVSSAIDGTGGTRSFAIATNDGVEEGPAPVSAIRRDRRHNFGRGGPRCAEQRAVRSLEDAGLGRPLVGRAYRPRNGQEQPACEHCERIMGRGEFAPGVGFRSDAAGRGGRGGRGRGRGRGGRGRGGRGQARGRGGRGRGQARGGRGGQGRGGRRGGRRGRGRD